MHKRKETTPVLYLLRPDCEPCRIFDQIAIYVDNALAYTLKDSRCWAGLYDEAFRNRIKESQLGTFCPYAIVYCYLEFKLSNLKLFSITIKELHEPVVLWNKGDGFVLFLKAFSWQTDLWVTLGYFVVKNPQNWEGEPVFNWILIKLNPCYPEGFSQTYFPTGVVATPLGLSILKVI